MGIIKFNDTKFSNSLKILDREKVCLVWVYAMVSSSWHSLDGSHSSKCLPEERQPWLLENDSGKFESRFSKCQHCGGSGSHVQGMLSVGSASKSMFTLFSCVLQTPFVFCRCRGWRDRCLDCGSCMVKVALVYPSRTFTKMSWNPIFLQYDM